MNTEYSKISYKPLFVVIVTILTMVLVSEVYAQVSSLNEGDRVKISVPTIQRGVITGRVIGISPEVLTIATDDDSLALLYSSIDKLYISRGKRRNFGKGAITGGILFGLTTAIATGFSSDNDSSTFTIQPSPLLSFAGGAVVGGLIGGAIGFAIKGDRWKKVSMELAVGETPYSLQSSSLRPGISLKIPFPFQQQ